MAGQAREIHHDPRSEQHVHHVPLGVARVGPDPGEVAAGPDQAFSEEKTDRQLVIMPRRAHRDADRPGVHADFKRLFASQMVVGLPRR